MNKKYIFLIVIIIIVIILGAIFIIKKSADSRLSPGSEEIPSANNPSNTQTKDSSPTTNTNNNPASSDVAANANSGSSAINGGGGGGGGSSSDENPETNPPLSPECQNVMISYMLASFNKNSVCNEYSGEVCVDKTLTCSIQIQNLDSTAIVEFKSIFKFYNSQGELINSAADSRMIAPRNTEYLEKSFSLTDEEANNDMDCSFSFEEQPSKEVC